MQAPVSAFLPGVLGWLLLAAAAFGLWRQGRAGADGPLAAARWWLLAGVALVCLRWPVMRLPYEIHLDESQLLAGAITLRADPMFWRSVDGNTAGPLDFYALVPAAFLPGGTAYLGARLTATVLIWATLVLAAEAAVALTRGAAARLAALPPLLFAASTTSPEFLHYSTELVPGFLLALAVAAVARRETRPTRANLWTMALALGAVPWAKLQAAPIAAVLGIFLVAREVQSGRRGEALLLVAAAAVPTVLVLAALAATGQTEHMVIPYIVQNLLYTTTGRLPPGTVALQQWQQAVTNGYLAAWLLGTTAYAAIALPAALKLPVRRALAGGLLLLAVTVCSILAPGRPYSHYLNLLLLPLTLVTGLLLAATEPAGPRRGRAGLAFALCLVAPLLVVRLWPREDPYAYYNTVVAAPSAAHRGLLAEVRALAAPGEPLGLWGWRSSLYVEAGLPQATCQAHTESLLIAGPSQQYYLRRYFEKMTAATPPVFVDAVGPGNFRFQDRAFGHEVFPRLRDWVRERYRLVAELDGVRVYARLDRVARAGGRASP